LTEYVGISSSSKLKLASNVSLTAAHTCTELKYKRQLYSSTFTHPALNKMAVVSYMPSWTHCTMLVMLGGLEDEVIYNDGCVYNGKIGQVAREKKIYTSFVWITSNMSFNFPDSTCSLQVHPWIHCPLFPIHAAYGFITSCSPSECRAS